MTKREQVTIELNHRVEHFSQCAIEAVRKGLATTAGLYACMACYWAKFLQEEESHA